ncbi:YheC/YheD family endospore coat-associated protein [Paenibacillus koleovorans]|uniref:YheC/YheD family endospore coat-associated protein n=1 Tax=Paenibacillus koleovorans TaxID=121608 RepID=UPI000FDA6611|nr:YheC/YheD family protein [Paenibacillus koleovorans]
MDNRYVGIILNDSLYRRIPAGRVHHESLSCYEVAGRLHGVTPCYIRLNDLYPGQTSVMAYVRSDRGYVRKSVPVPKVIHNRGLYFNSNAKLRIERLVKSGKQIFNGWNRYGKKTIHDLLLQDAAIRPHLPVTVTATTHNIRHMMTQYDSLIVKPNSSSIGRGIMKLSRQGNRWVLDYAITRRSMVRRKVAFRTALPGVLVRRIRSTSYLVQQCWPLATYRGRPFDLRVSVQRNESGAWHISGIAVKVAKPNVFLTNLAQGGSVYSLDSVLGEYPHLNPVETRARVEQLSLAVAERLSCHLPHLADIGLDVGIDASGMPLFIECNGRDLRISFQEGNQLKEFQQTYSSPIGYAKYLLSNGGE